MDYETVRAIFDYREDGNLIWKIKRSGTKKIKVAGAMHRNGYKVISYKGKQYPAHRLIWLYHQGFLPEKGLFIDHINRHRDDNRIENLRMVSNQCNQRNTGNWNRGSNQVKGVYWLEVDKVWRANIVVMNKLYNLGNYQDYDEAILARLAVEQCLGWEGCDSCSPAYQYAVKHKLIKEKNNVKNV